MWKYVPESVCHCCFTLTSVQFLEFPLPNCTLIQMKGCRQTAGKQDVYNYPIHDVSMDLYRTIFHYIHQTSKFLFIMIHQFSSVVFGFVEFQIVGSPNSDLILASTSAVSWHRTSRSQNVYMYNINIYIYIYLYIITIYRYMSVYARFLSKECSKAKHQVANLIPMTGVPKMISKLSNFRRNH